MKDLFFFYELWKETSTRVEYVHLEIFLAQLVLTTYCY